MDYKHIPSPEFMRTMWQVADQQGWDKDKTEKHIAQFLGVAKFEIDVTDWEERRETFKILRAAGKI